MSDNPLSDWIREETGMARPTPALRGQVRDLIRREGESTAMSALGVSRIHLEQITSGQSVPASVLDRAGAALATKGTAK